MSIHSLVPSSVLWPYNRSPASMSSFALQHGNNQRINVLSLWWSYSGHYMTARGLSADDNSSTTLGFGHTLAVCVLYAGNTDVGPVRGIFRAHDLARSTSYICCHL